jgi:putative FmdB family regulatory protein
MPLFEYRCNECKRKFSLLVGVTAKKEKQVCPRCGSRKLAKLISRISPVVRADDSDGDFDGSDLDDSDSDLGDDEDLGGDYDDDLD